MSISETRPSSKGKMIRGKHPRNNEPEDPEVSRMLEELFGSEAPVKQNSKAVKRSSPVGSLSTSSKLGSEMKGGTLPLVEFRGVGKKRSQEMIGGQKERNGCLRLVREARAKLKYLWSKANEKSPWDGSLIGTERTSVQKRNTNEVEVPLSLQIGEPSLKT